MKKTPYFVTGKCLTENKCLYVADYYLGDLIKVDLINNTIKTIVLDEEDIYLIYEIYFDGKKIIMYPRNSRKIYIVDHESYKKDSIELQKEISDYTFPIFYNNKLFVFERREKSIWLIDYNLKKFEKVSEYQEKHNFTNITIYEDEVLFPSPDTNSLYIYSFKTKRGKTIWFKDKITGITKIYKFQKYFVGFNLYDNSINFFDLNGEKIMNFETRFEKIQIEPYIFQKNTNTICLLSNTDGIVYEININDRTLNKRKLNILNGKDICYFQETEDKIHGIEITETYEKVLESIYEINKQFLDIKVYPLNYWNTENDRINKVIKRYIYGNSVINETKAINLKQLINTI